LARSKKKSTNEGSVKAAPVVEVSKKGETMFRVGEHNTFKDKIYAEKFAARKGLTVETITV
jgi:hypothetical protein